MPIIPRKRVNEKPSPNDPIDAFLASMWRSKRGNLWRKLDCGIRVTIFSRGDSYSWSIDDGDGVYYTHQTYETEEDAAAALLEEIDRDRWEGRSNAGW